MLVQLPRTGDWIRAEEVRSIKIGYRSRVIVKRCGQYSYEGKALVVRCNDREDAALVRDEIAAIVKDALGERRLFAVA